MSDQNNTEPEQVDDPSAAADEPATADGSATAAWTCDAPASEPVALNRDARKQQSERSLDLIERGYADEQLRVPLFHAADAPPRPQTKDQAWLRAELKRVQNALHDLQSVIDLPPTIVAPGLACLLARAVEATLVVEGVAHEVTQDGLALPRAAPGADAAVRKEELALLLQAVGLARKARSLELSFERADRRHLSELISASQRALSRLRKRARGGAREMSLSPRVLAIGGGVAITAVVAVLLVGWYLGRGVALEPVAALDKPPGRPGGISGSYYGKKDFTGAAKHRVDRGLSFHWRAGPMPELPKDNFSVQWKGFLRFDERGSYKICADSDDGIRLSLADVKVLENWVPHAKKRDCAEVYAAKPGWYALKLDYFEQHGDGHVAVLRGYDNDKERLVSAGHLCCQDR